MTAVVPNALPTNVVLLRVNPGRPGLEWADLSFDATVEWDGWTLRAHVAGTLHEEDAGVAFRVRSVRSHDRAYKSGEWFVMRGEDLLPRLTYRQRMELEQAGLDALAEEMAPEEPLSVGEPDASIPRLRA